MYYHLPKRGLLLNYRICFAAYLRMLGRRESTIKSYGRALVEYAAYCGRQKKSSGLLKQFNPHKLQSYKDSLLYDRGLRPSTVNRRLSALSAFARFLLSKGLLKGNPLELVPRAGREEINKEHMQKVWDGVQHLRAEVHQDVINVRDRAVVELLYAGLSVRELCSLKYDVSWNPDSDSITVGERRVALHARACLALEHYMILRPILRGDYLFVGSGPGWSMKTGCIYAVIRRLARMLGENIRVQDLRRARYAGEVYGFEPVRIPAAVAA